MSRGKRKLAAEETISILSSGHYVVSGKKVSIAAGQSQSVENAVLLQEEESKAFFKEMRTQKYNTCFSCNNESTVAAIHRFYQNGLKPVGVLNFASAKNPGGGFLNGAVAQEESLAISSGLYYTQTRNRAYYDMNRSKGGMFYTHTAIFSPDVIFFRDENLNLLEMPALASIITLPAVNMNLIKNSESALKQSEVFMKYRMRLCLAIFQHYQIENIILGAYGCGVFKQKSEQVSLWWEELLQGEFKHQFKNVHFAVLDHSKTQQNIICFDKMTQNLVTNMQPSL